MSTHRSRARNLRGALVGGCSALVTALAHVAGGGGVPLGGPMALLVVGCATVGASASAINPRGRRAWAGLVIGTLCAAQAVGHLTLALAGGHHGHSALLITAPMLGLHAAGAVVLGILIAAVEHLYSVCSTVLGWLQLFAANALRPAVVAVTRQPNVVLQPVLPLSGLGMRAPPLLPALSI